MAQDLFLNATILIAFISLGNQFLFREHKINIHAFKSSNIILGILTGTLGCILMLYSVTVVPGVILDLKSMSIIIASILGGFTSSIIASIIIGIFRISYFGTETSSIIALILALLMGFGCPVITNMLTSSKHKWGYATLYCNALVSIAYAFLIKDTHLLAKLLATYWIVSFVVTLILSCYIKRLEHLDELYRKYKEESSIDYLTGLNNVRQFDKVFNNISSKAIEREEYLSLLFIDIDFFKIVNDTYGHAEGDIVLKELGEVLLTTCRDFDIVSRNGGEEFSVMLIDCPPEQAIHIAGRIRSTVENHAFNLSTGVTIAITISIGVATYPNTTEDISKLIEQADKALYEAKQTGRNRVVFQKGKEEMQKEI